MSRKYKFASPIRYRSGHEKEGAYFVRFATVNWIDEFHLVLDCIEHLLKFRNKS